MKSTPSIKGEEMWFEIDVQPFGATVASEV